MVKPTYDNAPDAPTRNSPTTFRARMDAFLAWMPGFKTFVDDANTHIDSQADAAAASAGAASTSATTATTQAGIATTQAGIATTKSEEAGAAADASAVSANATAWVSGGSYTVGDVVWSLVNFASYRAKTTHSGETTDPVNDGTNWAAILELPHYTLTAGFDSDEEALGTITGGTVTPEVNGADEENFKTLTNNGAFTLAPPSTSSATTIRIRIINAVSAGAITTTGFDKVNDPDSYATDNAKEYWFYIDHDSTRSTLTISEIV